jgi:hypothetical protein
LDAKTDLSAASAALAGQIPAVVREVVSRSKLEMLRRTGTATGKITGPDILTVATEVSAENDLFRTKTRKDGLNFEAMAEIFTAAGTAMEEAAENHSVN